MASKFFVTRHRGAVTWAAEGGVKALKVEMEHFDAADLKPGDIVMGTLPVHVAAQVNAGGGHYWHLTMDVPIEFRGKELSAAKMREFGARLEEFRVQAHGVRVSSTAEHPIVGVANAKTHLCIATGQTLPNLLPLLALNWERVIIFTSKDMEQQAARLKWLADFMREVRGLTGPKSQIEPMPLNLDWETLRAFAARQATVLANDVPADFNLTGGQKLMTMAFAEAFRSQARLIYCSTKTESIDVIDMVRQDSVPLKPDLLDVDLYLAAQGFKVLRSVSPASPEQFKKVVKRGRLTASLVLRADLLTAARFLGTGYLGVTAASRRQLNFSVATLQGLLHALGSEAVAKTGRSGKLFEPSVRAEHAHDDAVGRGVFLEFKEKGLIKNLIFEPSGTDNAMRVEFDFADEMAATYMGGGYLEEYVWLCLHSLDIPDGQFAGNVGISLMDLPRTKGKSELNEMDAVVVWRNRLLVIECKAGVQLFSAKDQDILNKLDQLKDNVGGAMGSAWLIMPKPIAVGSTVVDRAELNGIKLVHGPDSMRNLAASLAAELRCVSRGLGQLPSFLRDFFDRGFFQSTCSISSASAMSKRRASTERVPQDQGTFSVCPAMSQRSTRNARSWCFPSLSSTLNPASSPCGNGPRKRKCQPSAKGSLDPALSA